MERTLLDLGLVFATGFLVTFITIPSIIEVAHKKKLFDVPDERKKHQQPIPSLGGVGIFMGMLIAYTLWSTLEGFEEFKYLLVGYLVLFFVGLKDDLVIMSAKDKFIIQFIVAVILTYGGVRITTLHGVLGVYDIPTFLSYGISIFFIVGVTNAFNLIDGIDGLAGGLGGINCLTLGGFLFAYRAYDFALLGFAVSGSLLAFLRYNFAKYPDKVFMGDTGSLLLGLTVSVLGIKFIQVEPITASGGLNFLAPPLVLVGVTLIPLFDTVRVMVLRVSEGRSPFSPDRNHIHHELLRSGADHKTASIILYIVNIALVATVIIFREAEALGLLVILLLVGSAAIQALIFIRYRKRDKKMSELNQKLQSLQKENQFFGK